jgi:hypothetical protein
VRPAEPFLTGSRPALQDLPELAHAAESGRGESLVTRVAAAGVLCAAVAAIVWYVVEAVLAF